MTGQGVWVPAHGARRRLQALAALGWSTRVIAEKIGSHYRPLLKISSGERESVRLDNHQRIARVFRELSAVVPSGHSANITRGWAAKNGYAPPLAWDDIDDPRERPKGVVRGS